MIPRTKLSLRWANFSGSRTTFFKFYCDDDAEYPEATMATVLSQTTRPRCSSFEIFLLKSLPIEPTCYSGGYSVQSTRQQHASRSYICFISATQVSRSLFPATCSPTTTPFLDQAWISLFIVKESFGEDLKRWKIHSVMSKINNLLF